MTLEQLKQKLPMAAEAVLQAVGEEGVRLVRQQMQSGYARPVQDTGALMADVQARRANDRALRIGNTLPYAAPVHDGTRHVSARPYLTDALADAEGLREAAVAALRRCL